MDAKYKKPKKGRTPAKKSKWKEAEEDKELDRLYGFDSGSGSGKFDVDSYVDQLEWDGPESFDDY